MRGFVFAVALAAVSACQKEPDPAQPTPSAAQQPPEAPVAGIVKASSVEGWETTSKAYPLIGATLPEFKAKRLGGGGEATQDSLRDRWTIIGFWSGSAPAAQEEMRYIGALNSAANQDPDLDFLSVYLEAGGDFDVQIWGAGANAWPTLQGDAALIDTFGVANTPAYLLIGPDLTIEAYRGALAETPDDGIKSVIRGVAEIKKQIAAPE
jgi:hypothetical protein